MVCPYIKLLYIRIVKKLLKTSYYNLYVMQNICLLNTGLTWHFKWIDGITATADASAIGGKMAIVDISTYVSKPGFGVNKCYDSAAYPCVYSVVNNDLYITCSHPGTISLEIRYMGY